MKWASFAELQAALKTDGVLQSWAVTALFNAGLVALTAEGGVAGVPAEEAEPASKKKGEPVPKGPHGGKRTAPEWGARWPSRAALLKILEDGGERGLMVADIRRELFAVDEVDHQWSVLHALWFLEKEKVARSAGKRWFLVGIEGAQQKKIEDAEAAKKWRVEQFWLGLSEQAQADFRAATANTGNVIIITENLQASKTWDEVWKKVALTEYITDILSDLAHGHAEASPPVTSGGEGGAS